ncbi:cellulose binding domain-containing protein [Spirillospora sp. NPDC048819]|uniref:cellulose binding domain-containing protein n=1 Tax=Spirillospora sp. NPDC048819 TaxID=3155268 RepID=UPI0033D526AF
MEGDELSGEEPGYVPPDHKTTAEFRVPGKAAEPEAAVPGPEATFVDEPVGGLFGSGATLQDVPKDGADVTFSDVPVDDPEDDLPQDDPEDDLDATFQDPPLREADVTFQEPPDGDVGDEAPVTVVEPPVTLTDGSAGIAEAPVTAADVPVPRTPSAPPEAAVFEMPAPVYGQASVPEQATAPENAPAAEQAVPQEQAPAAGQYAPAPEEGPWTEQFAAEGESTNPGGAGPAFAYAMPGPPQGTVPPPHEMPTPAMPAAASPSGGVPPVAPVMPSGPSGPSGASRVGRPLLLIALVLGVVLLAAAGVVTLLYTAGGGGEGKTATSPSPAASAPATEGGEPAPTASGAPAAPPSGGPSGGPPGQQPGQPPAAAPTVPIGPVMQGKGITYQLVQQDEGYFEGRMIITNRTDKPMKTWRLTFTTPGADVKNIWGARLVKGGEKVELENLEDAPAIPPGGTWDVQFGAAGITTTPKGCKLNGRACGF